MNAQDSLADAYAAAGNVAAAQNTTQREIEMVNGSSLSDRQKKQLLDAASARLAKLQSSKM